MQAGFKEYICEAFNARPFGLWIPPNWIGLGLFGMLGFVDSGFWILGLGLELGYLFYLATNPRFQNVVKGRIAYKERLEQYQKLNEMIQKLDAQEQQKYRELESRCRSLLMQVSTTESAIAAGAQAEGLRRLLWIFLKLLLTRQAIIKTLKEAAGREEKSLDQRIGQIEERIKSQAINEDLRKSLTGQVEILRQRQEKHKEAKDKLLFLDAELMRIQEQVELLREQSVLSTGPEVVSQRIDQISATLGDTTQWIQEQQRIYGCVEDLLTEPPPLSIPAKERQSQ
ncbi:MAG: hypothetical protein ABFD91_18010 [Anaerohalosphaeraceae bacterium]